MVSNGVEVIPTISWSTAASYDFAFAGIAENSTVAVSTVGIRGTLAESGYFEGLEAMMDALRPDYVLVYGRSLGEDTVFTSTPFEYFKTRWDE